MAGLALGSGIAARLILRRIRPLRLYAGLESIVAIFGCTLVFGLPLLGQWLHPIFQASWHGISRGMFMSGRGRNSVAFRRNSARPCRNNAGSILVRHTGLLEATFRYFR